MKKQSFSIITLGCPKNTVDSENMAALMEKEGFVMEKNVALSDIVIINTCSFIEDAKEESVDMILSVAENKKEHNQKIVVCGCLAQRYGKELSKQLPEVDCFVGTGEFYNIASAAKRVLNGERFLLTENINAPILECPRVVSTPPHYVYIKLSEGCDKHCTYCAIPSFRGKLRSREMEDIVSEVEDLYKKGVKEFILISQDDGEYGTDLYCHRALADLLKKLDALNGDMLFRLLYLYPETITDELIDVIKNSKKIAHYFDIPIQHVNDEVLKRMNRHTSKKDIITLYEKLRREMPDCALRTSLIVGFPGETKENYEELSSFLCDFPIDRVGVFCYSKEDSTPAAKMTPQVHYKTKELRRAKLMELQENISGALLSKRVGKIQRVIIDEETPECYVARSQYESPEIDGEIYVYSDFDLKVGEFYNVKITSNGEHDLFAEVIE